MLINFEGRQIGGYTLLSELGRGGMSRVYRASRPDTSQQFAIKLVSALTTRDENFERRFKREVAIASQMNHPGILPVLASGQDDDGTLYMIMPLVENGTLKDYLLSRLTLTIGAACLVASQIGEALDYAHGKGIIHRDVKPHNIMMLGGSRVALTDFGVASLESIDETVTNLTSTGATLGTFAYMSPEQIAGGSFDGRADIYSLGVVLYQGLVGRLPFTGDNTATLLSQQLHSLPIAPHLVSPGFPAEVEAVLDRALAKKPEERYQTGAELGEALRQAASALTDEQAQRALVTPEQVTGAAALVNTMITSAEIQAQPAQPRFSRRLMLIGLAVLLLGAVVACAGFILPLQSQLTQAQGTAAALGSRTPVIVTQMVTNAAGQAVIIQITATPDLTTSTPTPTPSASPTGAVGPTAQVTATGQPTAEVLATAVTGGSGSSGQSGSGVSPTSAGGGGTTGGGAPTAVGGGSASSGNAGGNSGSAGGGSSSGSGNSGGKSGGSKGKP